MNYAAHVRWTGSTAVGYEKYDRTHLAVARPALQEVWLTTGERLGDPALLNPEQLVVMAASSCQLLWFLHLAARARIDVVEYVDEASGSMPGKVLERIVLRPRIVVVSEVSEDRVLRLVELAHRECNIANSLRCEVEVSAAVEVRVNGGADEPQTIG